MVAEKVGKSFQDANQPRNNSWEIRTVLLEEAPLNPQEQSLNRIIIKKIESLATHNGIQSHDYPQPFHQ